MENFCSNCGAKLKADAKFCSSCGQKVQYDSPKSAPTNSTYTPLSKEPELVRREETFQEMFLLTTGRLKRLRYFKRLLVIGFIHVILIATIFAAYADSLGNLNSTGDVLSILLGIILLVPRYCLDVRRLHDMGKDETLAYFFATADLVSYLSNSFNSENIPLILGGIVFLAVWLYVLFTPGNIGRNKYGEDPLEK